MEWRNNAKDGGERMADGNTVDSLEIEIEASSSQAEEKITALTKALKDLQEATRGKFGDIQKQIEGLGQAAGSSGAQEKVRRKREALDRAMEPARRASLSPTLDAEKAGSQLETLNKKIENVKANIAEINQAKQMLGFAHDKAQGAQAIEEQNRLLAEQQAILDGLLQKREKLSDLLANGPTMQAKQEHPRDLWSALKSQFQGTKLGDIIGDTSSIDEAVNKMANLDDKVSILQIKLDGLRGKLQGAFEIGNQSQIANYASQIQKLKEQMAELQAKNSGKEQVEAETSLQKKLSVLERIKGTLSFIRKIQGEINGLQQGKFTGTGKDQKAAYNAQLKTFKDMKNALSSQRSLWSDIAPKNVFKGIQNELAGLMTLFPKFGAAVKGISYGFNTIVAPAKKAFSVLKKGLEPLASMVKKLTSSLKNLAVSGVSKAVSGLKSVGKSVVSSFTRPFTDALKSYNKWKTAIGRIAVYRAVREAIKAVTDGFKTGTDNLYQYSRMMGTEFAPAMDRLATSALYLKNSLGAMAAPLVQALAPAIDFLIDKFVALINAIGKAFAMLTGKSVYTQAKKHAVDYADAANSASKATQKFLLGIDELTILDSPAGGGGGAASDFGSMFEEVEIDQDQFDWVKQIREDIEKGEWHSVGEILANKLNEVVDGWRSYEWGKKLGQKLTDGLNVINGFLEKFEFDDLGGKIAKFFNGLFDGIEWDMLGDTIAKKWNALFDTVYGFATELKRDKIGSDISQAMNGFLDELDPEKAAEAFSTFITGLFTLIDTAIKETKWETLGEKLAEFINKVNWYDIILGAFTLIKDGLSALKKTIDAFLGKWDWKDTAGQLSKAINDSFNDATYFEGFGETLGNAITTAFNFLKETIKGISWENIGKDLASFLNGIKWSELLSSVATTIAEAFNAVVTTVSTLVRELDWEEVGRSVGEAINDFFATFDFGAFFTGLENLIRGIITGLSAAVKTTKWDEIGKELSEQFATFINSAIQNTDWVSVGQAFSNGIRNAIQTLKTLLKEIDWAGIARAIVDFLAGVDWIGLARDLADGLMALIGAGVEMVVALIVDLPKIALIGAEIVAGLLQGIKDTWNSIVEFFQGAFGPIADAISWAWNAINGDTKLKLVEMSTISNDTVTGIKTGMESTMGEIVGIVGEAWNSANTDTATKWGSIKADLDTTWDGISTQADTNFGEIKDTISDTWENASTKTSTEWGAITKDLNTSWSGINTDAGTKFDGIKKIILDAWTNASTETSTQWGTIKRDLNTNLNDINTDVNTQFDSVKTAIKTAWGNANEETFSAFDTMKSNIHEKAEEIQGRVTTDFKGVADNIRSPIENVVKDAKSWGEDICKNLAAGMSGIAKGAVTSAANSLAKSISDRLHFSEPDIGPLSDFHTYMPDMLDLMSKGIRDNSYKTVSAANELAGRMSEALGNIEPVEPRYSSIPTPQYAAVSANAQGSADSVSAYNQDGQGPDYTELINVFYAGIQQVVAAIHENGDRPVNIDWTKAAAQTTSVQNRQNMMYGKTLQNY